jgi:hypothetical protein
MAQNFYATHKPHEVNVHEINREEVVYYVIVWFVACAAALARVARDREFVNFWNCLGIGATSGFYGFGVVALFFVPHPTGTSGTWYWIGVSALVGLLGKEQDAIGKTLVNKIFSVAKMLQEREDKS